MASFEELKLEGVEVALGFRSLNDSCSCLYSSPMQSKSPRDPQDWLGTWERKYFVSE